MIDTSPKALAELREDAERHRFTETECADIISDLIRALREARMSEESWREQAEYWEALCRAVAP
jgi:hypothetical protein